MLMLTDLTYLQQLTGNDSGMMTAAVELFFHQVVEMREDFELLMNQKNWPELSRLAHKIKSSALVMGIGQIVDDMKELEFLAKEGKSTEKYSDYFARFCTMIELVEVELKIYIEN